MTEKRLITFGRFATTVSQKNTYNKLITIGYEVRVANTKKIAPYAKIFKAIRISKLPIYSKWAVGLPSFNATIKNEIQIEIAIGINAETK